MSERWTIVRRWLEAWVIGTFVIWIARRFHVPWAIALLVGGFLIGVVESFLDKRQG